MIQRWFTKVWWTVVITTVALLTGCTATKSYSYEYSPEVQDHANQLGTLLAQTLFICVAVVAVVAIVCYTAQVIAEKRVEVATENRRRAEALRE